MVPVLIKDLLTSAPDQRAVTVCGWVRTVRDSKNLVFIQVNDGSCFANIQLTFDRNNPGNADVNNIEEELKKITTGASVRAEGVIIPSPASGQAVEVTLQKLTVLGICPPEEYPLQKNKMSMEDLRDNAHLRARTTPFGAVFRMKPDGNSPAHLLPGTRLCLHLRPGNHLFRCRRCRRNVPGNNPFAGKDCRAWRKSRSRRNEDRRRTQNR